MSFILDALRKAEHRNRDQRGLSVPSGPSVLMDETPEAPTNWRMIFLASVIGAALLIAGLVFGLRDKPPTIPAADMPANSQLPANPAPQTPDSATAPPAAASPAIARDDSQRAVPRDSGARALDKEVAKTQARNSSVANDSTARTPAPTPPASRVAQVRTEALPDYLSVVASGDVILPQLHLDMHVYSREPKKRFVFINLNKYRQGDNIDPATAIESIDTDGVVINHKGFRFVLKPD